ncbi:hypothetical protein DUI87_29281 [Hirundo rustica rustica]|uniref:Uncharacterized protein n=1 Tax=Hirundo rustica rustica TaxID=333673 RepID=A0A3M0J2C7_HIRRU|nr:hypothetical protein DUI87_29281 [Hirundo rustica rustica]
MFTLTSLFSAESSQKFDLVRNPKPVSVIKIYIFRILEKCNIMDILELFLKSQAKLLLNFYILSQNGTFTPLVATTMAVAHSKRWVPETPIINWEQSSEWLHHSSSVNHRTEGFIQWKYQYNIPVSSVGYEPVLRDSQSVVPGITACPQLELQEKFECKTHMYSKMNILVLLLDLDFRRVRLKFPMIP